MATADADLAAPAPRRYVPWSQRWIVASGLSPWLAGGVIATALLAGLLAVFGLGALLGFSDLAQPWFWSELGAPNVVNALLIGFAPAALAWSRRAALAQLERLRPLLTEAAFASFRAQLASFPRAPLALAGGVFAALIVPLVIFDPGLRESFAKATPLARAWQLWVNALVGWLMARSILEELRVALLFARIGGQLERVDLFELRPLEPFARRAVEGVLVWVIAASLTSILFAGGWASATLPQLVGTILFFALAAFVLPLLGVHRRIRAAKQQPAARHAPPRPARIAQPGRRRARVAGGFLHPVAPAPLPLPRDRPRVLGRGGAGGSRDREAAALTADTSAGFLPLFFRRGGASCLAPPRRLQMRMMRTAGTGLALTLALALAPGLAQAKSDKAQGSISQGASTSSNGNGIGAGGVPALRDRLLALIDALGMRLDQLTQQVNHLEDAVAATDGRVTALEGDVADLDARLDAIESQFSDDDGDSFSEVQDDCDDANGNVSPLATEIPGNGIDDDCDHLVDEP